MNTFTQLANNLFLWTDTCNVYVVRDGDAALLIDLGDGSVLDHLGEIGVRHVEWVWFTHHHREQCQGAPRLAAWRERGTQVACGANERQFFETPASFRKLRPTLNDAHSVYGASYIRPPIEPVKIDRVFKRMDDFTWRGREFWCVETPGNSPGHMSYLARLDGQWHAFTGDLMLDGAKMHTWFDTEWDYGFAKGLYELGNSAAQIAGFDPAALLPAHGAVVRNARAQLTGYIAKLRALGELYVRGYDINRFAGCDQDNVSRPTSVPHIWQITPHLFKFRGPNYWPNFTLLLADNGHALVVDCGLFEVAFLEAALERMKARLGLRAIDACFVTHMHGDHGLQAAHLREKWGAKLWTMAGVADTFERPWDFDLSALLPFYGPEHNAPLKFDRVLRVGEVLEWNGFTFACDWMPGQTKYHACLHGEIDGRRVAFTGDNIFASTTDPRQGGNEAVVARNGGALEEGYLYAAEFLHGIEPDLIIGGHSWVLDRPRELIERYRRRAVALREAFQSLSTEEDYRYMFDPYWVRAMPYRVAIKPGGSAEFTVQVRNFLQRAQKHRVTLRCPAGLRCEPGVLESSVAPESTASFDVQLQADSSAKAGIKIVAFDITLDGRRQGELFDFIAAIG